MSTPTDFKRLRPSFIEVTRRYIEKAGDPDDEMSREAISLHRAPVLIDALEEAYARLDRLEALEDLVKEIKDLLVPNVYKHGEAILLLQKIKEIRTA